MGVQQQRQREKVAVVVMEAGERERGGRKGDPRRGPSENG